MKTLDPTGLYRYLHPRASGLIVFKGGGDEGTAQESTVTEGFTEAADTAAEIDANVTSVGEDVTTGFAETNAALNEVDTNIGTASETGTTTATGGSFVTPVVETTADDGTVTMTGGETVEYGGGEVPVTDTVKGDTESLIGGQSDLSSQIDTRFNTFQPVSVTNTSIDTSDLAKSNAMNEGFASVTQNQGSILSDTGTILNDTGEIKTGVADVGNKISDLSGNVGERFDTVDDTLSKGFTDTSDQITTGFGNQADTLETLSSNVLGGQTSLQEYLEKVSGKQDTYFGGLSEGQANIQSGLGGLQTNFSDFENQYTDDTTLANQARADLQSQVTGGFKLVRDDISQSNDMAEQQRSRIARDAQDDSQQMQSSFGAALRNIDAGVEAQSQDEVTTRNDIKQRLSTIRQVILQDGANLDPNLSMQFAKFADSFDENGSLIKSSTDNRGNVTQRALDNENNLNLATFANTGTLVSRDSINVDEVMSAMDRLGYTGAQNNQGLMSQGAPFNSTFS